MVRNSLDVGKFDPAERCFLQDFSTDAILAGGAPRDLTLGRPVSDYDFYLTYTEASVNALYKLGFKSKRLRKGKRQYDDPSIKEVLNHGKFDVILVEGCPIVHILTCFCASICKIYATVSPRGQLSIVPTPAFNDTVESGVIKVYMDVHHNPHLMSQYLPKLHRKYPEYEMVLTFDEEI